MVSPRSIASLGVHEAGTQSRKMMAGINADVMADVICEDA